MEQLIHFNLVLCNTENTIFLKFKKSCILFNNYFKIIMNHKYHDRGKE